MFYVYLGFRFQRFMSAWAPGPEQQQSFAFTVDMESVLQCPASVDTFVSRFE